MNEYNFNHFIDDLETYASSTHSYPDMIRSTIRSMQLLIDNPDLLTSEDMNYLLSGNTRKIYQSPHHGFVVLVFGWHPGSVTPIHDHNTWGVMGIYQNQLQN